MAATLKNYNLTLSPEKAAGLLKQKKYTEALLANIRSISNTPQTCFKSLAFNINHLIYLIRKKSDFQYNKSAEDSIKISFTSDNTDNDKNEYQFGCVVDDDSISLFKKGDIEKKSAIFFSENMDFCDDYFVFALNYQYNTINLFDDSLHGVVFSLHFMLLYDAKIIFYSKNQNSCRNLLAMVDLLNSLLQKDLYIIRLLYIIINSKIMDLSFNLDVASDTGFIEYNQASELKVNRQNINAEDFILNFDIFDGTKIHGWMLNTKIDSNPDVDIYINNLYLMNFKQWLPREDVSNHFETNNIYVGFIIPIPDHFINHSICLKFINKNCTEPLGMSEFRLKSDLFSLRSKLKDVKKTRAMGGDYLKISKEIDCLRKSTRLNEITIESSTSEPC